MEGVRGTVSRLRSTEGKGVLFHTAGHGRGGVIADHRRGFSREEPDGCRKQPQAFPWKWRFFPKTSRLLVVETFFSTDKAPVDLGEACARLI